MTGSNKTHPWELAWREQRWAETSPPISVVADFAEDLKREGARTVLDLGCGAGRHSILLGKKGFRCGSIHSRFQKRKREETGAQYLRFHQGRGARNNPPLLPAPRTQILFQRIQYSIF